MNEEQRPRSAGFLRETGWYALLVLAVLLVRAILVHLWPHSFPLAYWRYPDLLPRIVYFFDVLLFGLAHCISYFFLVSGPMVGWHIPDAAEVILSVLGFVVGGFAPHAISLLIFRRRGWNWRTYVSVACVALVVVVVNLWCGYHALVEMVPTL